MEVDDLEVEQPEVETSIEEDIRNAMASLKTDAESAPSEPVIEKPRDDTGKFAEKQPETTSKRDTLSLPEKTGDANAVVAEVSEAPVATLQAPKGLRPEFKAKFGELPADWQAEISRRESDAAKAVTAQDEERMLGKKVNEMASPYLPTIRAEGATVEKAFQDYLQTAHVLRQGTDYQKAQSIAAVMGQFKVNPQVLLSILQGGNVNTGNQPSPAQYNPQLETLQQRVDRMERERQDEVQQRQLQEEHSLKSQIEDFSSKPGHEHFDRVRSHMGVLLENGMATDLDDAYNRAVYADPEIRSTLIASQEQATAGQRLSEVKAKAEAARRAGGSVSGGPGAARAMNGSGVNVPIEETIRAALRESQGRV